MCRLRGSTSKLWHRKEGITGMFLCCPAIIILWGHVIKFYEGWKSSVEHTQLRLAGIHFVLALTHCGTHQRDSILEWELLRSPQSWQPSEMHLSTPLLLNLPERERMVWVTEYEGCNPSNSRHTESYKTHPDYINIFQVTSSELTHGNKMVNEGGVSPLHFPWVCKFNDRVGN